MTVSQGPTATQTVVLTPSYWVPLGVAIASVPLFLVQLWVGLIVLLFAGFLCFQTVTVRLHFTPTALELYRGDKQLRQFPYADWLNWDIFWSPIPILFYFREVKSIHFTPMLFDSNMLRTCLERHCPRNQSG